MNTPSQPTTTLFVALVAALAAVAVPTVMRAGQPNPRGRFYGSGARIAAALLLIYVLVPAVLARQGTLDRYAPLPAPALVLVFVTTLMTVGLAVSPFGARLASSVGVMGLVGFQVFRVPLEWLLHRLFLEGVIPVEMTYDGRNFDILSGLTAAGLGLWITTGRRIPRLVLIGWNLLGLGLLANIVIVAALCTPAPFRQFMDGPPNLLPSTFPFVWLPTFLVQAALLGHLLVLRLPGREASGKR